MSDTITVSKFWLDRLCNAYYEQLNEIVALRTTLNIYEAQEKLLEQAGAKLEADLDAAWAEFEQKSCVDTTSPVIVGDVTPLLEEITRLNQQLKTMNEKHAQLVDDLAQYDDVLLSAYKALLG